MLSRIIETYRSDFELYAFVERFGGLALNVTRQVVTEEGMTIPETIPVSPTVSGECWESQYKDLVPDTAKKSIFYFEDISGIIKDEAVRLPGSKRGITATIRLVGWLNLDLMGYDSPSVTDDIIEVVISHFDGRAFSVPGITGKLHFNQIPPKNHANFFGALHYSDRPDVFIYPHDYFAIDFTLKAHYSPGCETPFELGQIGAIDEVSSSSNPLLLFVPGPVDINFVIKNIGVNPIETIEHSVVRRVISFQNPSTTPLPGTVFTRVGGDDNSNDLLEVGELWEYTFQVPLHNYLPNDYYEYDITTTTVDVFGNEREHQFTFPVYASGLG